LGSYIDPKGYINVDENAPLLRYKCFNGEVNEEYEAAWATDSRDFRFGNTTNPFPYRYFISNLRAIQMQCTYVHTTGHLLPQMLPFMALELGRTVEDAPDVWAFLNTFYLKTSNYKNNDWKGRTFTATEEAQGIEAKNFERWLYQRDAVGYETKPEEKIQQAIKMWMVQTDKYYDYIARSGKKIGFDIDNRWSGINDTLAVKVTYFDRHAGEMNLVYHNSQGQDMKTQILTGDGKLKTATFFISKMNANSLPNNFDFTLEAGANTEKIVVSMVRVVQANPNAVSNKQVELGQKSMITIAYQSASNTILIKSRNSLREIDVYNTAGRKVKSVIVNQQDIELPTNGFSPGVYILKIKDLGGNVKQEKVMVI